MKKPDAASRTTPEPKLTRATSTSSPHKKTSFGETVETMDQRSQFLVMAAHMTWQLAIVVLVPVIVGVKLDKAYGTKQLFTFVGLGVALVGSVLVMWRAVRAANRLPVPKLTDEQKRAIQKQYEEDDDE